MLKAGIVLPSGERVAPRKGIPQGSVLSPLLCNIFLTSLDNNLENFCTENTVGGVKSINKEYNRLKSA